MKVVNHTPFPPLLFERPGPDDELELVTAVVGTFDIVHGEPLLPSQEQEPAPPVDVYADASSASYVLRAGEAVREKPATDVIATATAHAPGGRASRQWVARIRVGKLRLGYLHPPTLEIA